MYDFFYATIQPVNFSNIRCDIPELKGDNYKVWNERILLHLGWMDIDYAIQKDEPPVVTEIRNANTLLFMNVRSDLITLLLCS